MTTLNTTIYIVRAPKNPLHHIPVQHMWMTLITIFTHHINHMANTIKFLLKWPSKPQHTTTKRDREKQIINM